MRHAHELRRGSAHQRPRHVVFMDCEAYVHRVVGPREYQRLRLGHALYQRWRPGRKRPTEHWLEFTKTGEFWDWIYEVTPRRSTTWIMSCNLSYDFHILDGWKWIPVFGARVEFFHAGFGCTIITCHGLGRRLIFIDTMNVLPVSVKKLGDHVGRPKMDVDWRSGDTELVSEYCRRDVEIIRDAWNGLCDFIEENDFARSPMTLPSLAFNTYRSRFMPHDIHIHSNESVCKLERAGYFGGRSEVMRVGRYSKHSIFVLDINSMYGSVMRSNLFPCRLVGSGRHLPLTALGDKLDRYAVIARVRLDTDEPAYPYRGKRTLFPVGRFSTVLTTPELVYALDRGHVVEVLSWADYEKADLFSTFMDRLLTLKVRYKKAGNSLYEFITKRLINAFYGKFGQKIVEWRDVGHNGTRLSYIGIYHDMVSGISTTERCFFGWVQRQEGAAESRNSFPAIAAHVTAYARCRLWKLIRQAGPRNVLYTDTDSLMVTPMGLEALAPQINTTKPGMLKMEDAYEWIHIHTLKDYVTDRGRKLKGVPRTAIEIKPGVFQHELFPGFLTLLREHVSGEYPVITTVKVLKREYLKGNIGKGGWVTPYRLSEWLPKVHPD